MLKYLFNCLLDIIYPVTCECVVCGGELECSLICFDCESRSGNVLESYDILGFPIYSCKYYSSSYRELIVQYKGKHNFEVGDYFINLLIAKINALNLEFDYVTFVPSTNKVIKKRKFDHGLYLASGVSKCFKKPIIEVLIKRQNVKEQKYLNSNERLKNMESAFSIIENIKDLKGKRVLLVDDVLTTGATLKVCKDIIEKNYKIDIILLTVIKSSI